MDKAQKTKEILYALAKKGIVKEGTTFTIHDLEGFSGTDLAVCQDTFYKLKYRDWDIKHSGECRPVLAQGRLLWRYEHNRRIYFNVYELTENLEEIIKEIILQNEKTYCYLCSDGPTSCAL